MPIIWCSDYYYHGEYWYTVCGIRYCFGCGEKL